MADHRLDPEMTKLLEDLKLSKKASDVTFHNLMLSIAPTLQGMKDSRKDGREDIVAATAYALTRLAIVVFSASVMSAPPDMREMVIRCFENGVNDLFNEANKAAKVEAEASAPAGTKLN